MEENVRMHKEKHIHKDIVQKGYVSWVYVSCEKWKNTICQLFLL